MKRPSCFLEITVLSAEDLRLSKRSIKKNSFVTIRTTPQTFKSTCMDAVNGSYPIWDEKFELSLPDSVTYITVEVQCRSGAGVMTLIGAAKVPVSDFMNALMPVGYLHFLSYRLRDRDEERNGIINLSIKAKVPEGYVRPVLPILGGRFQAGNKSYGGVAIGIPVSCGSGNKF
ncbi:hypothetical protein GIB67_028393 [Kingdonia uniflora]|uniref:C2 domain-containing protein n=1 Tax=Kingdonia uniflora TaxID=39325 RepID=A0A7J7MI30_9MAGN|nr:hypothetical protein GIB67_028393 [Kingdonia uniflora]